jgi:hypothetical protein
LILAETLSKFYALAGARAYVLKSMSYPISDHADKLILGETVFNFYALACAGVYSKVCVIPSQTIQKNLD